MPEENKKPLCGDCESMENTQCTNPESPCYTGKVNKDMAGCDVHSELTKENPPPQISQEPGSNNE